MEGRSKKQDQGWGVVGRDEAKGLNNHACWGQAQSGQSSRQPSVRKVPGLRSHECSGKFDSSETGQKLPPGSLEGRPTTSQPSLQGARGLFPRTISRRAGAGAHRSRNTRARALTQESEAGTGPTIPVGPSWPPGGSRGVSIPGLPSTLSEMPAGLSGLTPLRSPKHAPVKDPKGQHFRTRRGQRRRSPGKAWLRGCRVGHGGERPQRRVQDQDP